MFAEDLGLIRNNVLSRVLEGLIKDTSRSSADDLGQLFRYLAEPDPRPAKGSLYEGTPFANGGLFVRPAQVHLEAEELETLLQLCNLNWRQVEPAIFGAILQGALGRDKQWALGAHYTAEADIMKVVKPTVIEPWSARIESLSNAAEAEAAWRDLMSYVVLDPACGSGNFLYVAYREIRHLELRLRERLAELRAGEGMAAQEEMEFFPISNMRGFEIEVFAAELARVTLWMGHKLAAEDLREHGLNEPTLPLVDLSGIRRAHALRTEWPEADAIIGNPPYHGSQMLRSEVGDEEVEFLKKKFGIGVKDYSVYWFRKAHERLKPGGRAGLVATNSVTQNRNRKPSLEWIVEHGGVITDAISTQDWTGEAAVDVSIVNWVKEPPREPLHFILDGVPVESITPSLRTVELDISGAERLRANEGIAFQGPQPVGAGFVLAEEEALELVAEGGERYQEVVRPYLVGNDILRTPGQQPTRYIIDFGLRSLEEAERFPLALRLVEERVKPDREKNRRESRRRNWWLLGELVPAMRAALAPLSRYLATSAVAKRFMFVWCESSWCPSNRTIVFALEAEAQIGVLNSSIHTNWALVQGGTFEDRPHYTHTTAFETFPWPSPSRPEIAAIATCSARLDSMRKLRCAENGIGLTELYNRVEAGAHRDLAAAQDELDRAVAKAYGWPAALAADAGESNHRLLELNKAIAAGELEYHGPRAFT
jgi:hypothetical protein